MRAISSQRHESSACHVVARWLAGLMAAWALVGLPFREPARGETPTIVTSYAQRPHKRIEIAPQNRPLSAVIEDLMEQVDANYIFDPSAEEALAKPYTGRLTGLTIDQALRSLLQASPITYITWGTATQETRSAADLRWTYTFYHIAAEPPKLPVGVFAGPPENQWAALFELLARRLAQLAGPEGPAIEVETVPLTHVSAQQVVELLEPFRSNRSPNPTASAQQLYPLGYLTKQLSPEGDEQLKRMEQMLAQKQQERDQLAAEKGPDDPQVIRLEAEIDDLRERYATIEDQVTNEIASVIRRILPGGALPVYLAPSGEGGDKVLVAGTRESIDRAKRAIAVVDQPPPQAEFEAYAEIMLRVGGKQQRFNYSTGGPCRAGQTLVTSGQLTSIPQSTLEIKVTPRAATRDAVDMDTTWNLSASIESQRLGVPIQIKRYLQSSFHVPTGQRVVVGRWQLTGDPDVSGTLTFAIAARAGARPGTAAVPAVIRPALAPGPPKPPAAD